MTALDQYLKGALLQKKTAELECCQAREYVHRIPSVLFFFSVSGDDGIGAADF